ncbi:MAG: YigZ family protein [Acutalibacteraceae bacterium]
MNSYKTVEKECCDEFIVKKSRFIGYVKPVKTAQQATDFIAEIKQKHWDATHNVYAYILRDGQIKRYSDDGEPQGTAGMPVLNVLLQQELCDVAVVVTRYFGGILLGTGGLVRAYSVGAKIAVESGNIITMSLCKFAKVCCDYNYYGKLVTIICKNGGFIIDTDFAENVTVSFNIPSEIYDKLAYEITDSSGGRYKSEVFDEKFSKI